MERSERVALVRKIKGLLGGEGVRFPIREENGSTIGYLRAIDVHVLNDAQLIATMAEARSRYRRNFLTQFNVTPENKQDWLRDGVLLNDDRVLFLVETDDRWVVGQDGFTLSDDGSCELDGTMRWLRYGHRRLFVRSGVERARICFDLFGCTTARTEVFTDNIANMKNSLRMGFTVMEECDLFLSENKGVVRYEKIRPGSGTEANTDRRLAVMEMTRGKGEAF